MQKYWSKNIHDREVEEAIRVLNEFEAKEGLVTEPAKTWILPVGGTHAPLVKVGGYEYQEPESGVGRILGHHIQSTSWVNKQAKL